MNQAYILIEDYDGYPKGAKVYFCNMNDFGCSKDDSIETGEDYISVTLNSNGDYPFFTIPKDLLKECDDE
jgi:hypothetical protein